MKRGIVLNQLLVVKYEQLMYDVQLTISTRVILNNLWIQLDVLRPSLFVFEHPTLIKSSQ